MPQRIRSRLFYLALGALAALFVVGSFSLGRLAAEERRGGPSGFTPLGGSGHAGRSQDGAPVSVLPHPAFAQASSPDGKTLTVADVAERSLPAVVNISTTRKPRAGDSPFHADPFFREFLRRFGPADPSPRVERGLGSGVIISADGTVVTNNHVIANADEIRVMLSNKREVAAKVVGTDPKSDLAVLKLADTRGLRPIRLGSSDQLRLGDIVVAVGNPFGVGQTVTMGIVSAKGRANMGIVDYEDFIQTDAAINPGNSGGALVNMRGELVGINTAILSRTGGYQGIGFAIPTNMMRPIVESLIKRGKVVRGWLGVVIQEVDRELADALKLPTHSGVLVADVTADGPAAKAGLRRGDLVVKINGQAVDSTGGLRNLVAAAGAEAKVRVDYYRDRRLQTTRVALTESPGDPTAVRPTPLDKPTGVVVAPLDRAHRARFNIPARVNFGVVVARLDPGSPVARAGLQVGDVILEVNRATIDSVSRFNQLYSAARGRVLLLLHRRGSTMFMILTK